MPSIFDLDEPTPRIEEPERPKRSKHRESLSSFELSTGRRKLADMVDRAFQCLEEAMISADHPTAIKAAQIILDRAGFGPKSTVDANTTTLDLTALTREELAERASKVATLLRGQQKVIDITPTVN